MILGIDTSTSRTDVAILDGERVAAHVHADGATSHGEVLGGLVAQAFRESEIRPEALTAVAVGTGPGPFTGLRVGLAFARTMALARSIPVFGICSLDVIAAAADIDDEFLVLTDARRKEVYWARYTGGDRADGPHVSYPAAVAQMWGDRPVIGEGARTYSDLFPRAQEPWLPSAVDLTRLALIGWSAGTAMPIDARYLRAPDVTV